jgi:ABC-2 type transport system permease protein
MNLAALADKMAVVLSRDLRTAVRYRTGFVLPTLGAIAELAAFYYLARAIGPGFRPSGLGYFEFLLVGTGAYTFFVMGIHAFLRVVQEAQQTGTMEVLMTTSTPASVVVFLSAMSALMGNTIRFACYLGAGLWLFGISFRSANLIACAIVFVLSFLITTAFGLIAAALQVSLQKGSAVLWLFGSAAWFMTGTLFPVASLPVWLQWISKLIPITYALEGLRRALLQGRDLPAFGRDVVILAAFSVVLFPLGLLLFGAALRQARQQGTLAAY